MLLTLALALACTHEQQEVLDPFPQALAAYDEGVALLDAGQTRGAVEAFERALAADPRGAELWLWKGRALASAGDLEGAIGAATEALALRPGWGLALYNRACWRSRAGSLEAAVRDLGQALETGEVGRLQAAADADLDPLRASPETRDRVPARALPALLSGEPESVFIGSDWTLNLMSSTPRGAALGVQWAGPHPGGLVPARVVGAGRSRRPPGV